MMRRMMRCVGLTNGSGMRSTSASAASGRVGQTPRRSRPAADATYLWPRSPVIDAGGGRTPSCNHDLSRSRIAADRQRHARAPGWARHARRHGTAAFRGAQAVRLDRPRRIARQRAVLHLRLRGRRGRSPAALLLGAADPQFGALAAVALFVAVFPANVNMVRLWWDKPLPDADRRDRPAAAADPDDHRGAEDLPRLLGGG